MTKDANQHEQGRVQGAQELQGGHTRTWTPAQRQRSRRKAAFLRALHEHGSLAAACLASGIHDTTVWRWRKQYPAFDQAVVNFTEGVREQRLVESMYRIATSEDPKMANAAAKAGEFLLKSWNREKYADFKKVEQTVSIHQTVQAIHEVRDQFRERQAEKLKALRTIDVLPEVKA